MTNSGDIAGTVLVTGASSGIGAAIVRSLCADGRVVVALARRKDRLEALAEETGCHTAGLDIREHGRVAAFVKKTEPAIVINSAGTAHGVAGLESTDELDIRTAIDTNVLAPIHLFKAAVEVMKEAGSGHLINIGSISGLHTIVSALYGASKGATHMLMNNLRMELRGTGIRVTEIAPGRTESELFDSANLDAEAKKRISVSDVTILSPSDIASAVLFAINAPPHVNIGLIELTPTEQVVGGAVFTPNQGKE